MYEKKPIFALTLPLLTEKWQDEELNTRFNIATKIHNAVLGTALRRYKEMIKTKEWRTNQLKLCEIKKISAQKGELKHLHDERLRLIKQYKLSNFELEKVVKPMQHHFARSIDSHSSQKIALRCWMSMEKLLFGTGEGVHFKKWYDGVKSIEAKDTSCISFKIKDKTIHWKGLLLKVATNERNEYETEALTNGICFCRIKRRFIRGSFKYYVDIVLRGVPPLKHEIGSGTCGIDIGTQTVAYTTKSEAKLIELADRVQSIEKEKRRLLRYMDRSKRKTNPENFNKNGTLKKKLSKWQFSKRYLKARLILKDMYRKQADIRRMQHQMLANDIIKSANICYVEKMNFKGLQRRAKKTEISEKTGKFKRKKRFGKSLANKAPAMFITILSNKLKARGGVLIEINTHLAKASQFNHLDQQYKKKKLCQRWNHLVYKDQPIKVQRDLYSAFLIKHIAPDLSSFDQEGCEEDFDQFLTHHSKEIERLSVKENLSSMGIKVA